jgi:squalene cyclase
MQWPGGYWIDFNLMIGMSSHWVTAYVAHCLNEAKPASPAILKAHSWLIETELSEGGWGFNRDVPPDADSIANVLLFFACSNRSASDKNLSLNIGNKLLSYQSAVDGGFATYLPRPTRSDKPESRFIYSGSGWCISHLSVTALAALALWTVDSVFYEQNLFAAASYIRQRQNELGFWEDHWWYGRTYGTYWATLFLHNMGESEALARAQGWLLESASRPAWGNGLGGNPSAFHTALALATLMINPNTTSIREAINAGIAWLLGNQLEDGSWPSVPILLTPIPEILNPHQSSHPSSKDAVADQHRQFTTATVLTCITRFRTLKLAQIESKTDR